MYKDLLEFLLSNSVGVSYVAGSCGHPTSFSTAAAPLNVLISNAQGNSVSTSLSTLVMLWFLFLFFFNRGGGGAENEGRADCTPRAEPSLLFPNFGFVTRATVKIQVQAFVGTWVLLSLE